jgi:hypothetical protein
LVPIFPPAAVTADSIAARALGVIEMMYLAVGPRLIASAGAWVTVKEKTVISAMKPNLNLFENVLTTNFSFDLKQDPTTCFYSTEVTWDH